MVAKELTSTDLSVVIPTYHGREKLPQALKSLERQTISGFEVIVVVDGSTDDTVGYLETYQTTHFRLEYIYQENQGRSRVRNKGAVQASGLLLLFLDDDMRLDPDVLEGHLRHHANYPDSVLVGGQYIPDHFMDECMRYRYAIEKKWYRHLPAYPVPMDPTNLFVTAAHLSLPRTLFKRLNGFDERLTDCEDIEFGYRLIKNKTIIYVDKRLNGWHVDPISWRSYVSRKQQYGRAKEKVNALHPGYATKTSYKMPWSKKVISPIFTFDWWIILMEKGTFKFLPTSIRYRVYSFILWVHVDYKSMK